MVRIALLVPSKYATVACKHQVSQSSDSRQTTGGASQSRARRMLIFQGVSKFNRAYGVFQD